MIELTFDRGRDMIQPPPRSDSNVRCTLAHLRPPDAHLRSGATDTSWVILLHPEVEALADLRVGSLDRAVVALAATTSITNDIVLDFDAELDPSALASAWQRLGRRYPILRGRADLDSGAAEWSVDDELPPVVFAEEDPAHCQTPLPGPAERRAFGNPSRPHEGGLCRLAAITRGSAHRLVWSCSHALMDGTSSAAVVGALAALYRDAVAGVSPNNAVDRRSRLLEDLLHERGPDVVTRSMVLARYAASWLQPERSDHPVPRSVSPAAGYAGADISDAISALDRDRRRYGWRTSAVILALLARAWNRVFDDGSTPTGTSGWQVASNLRVVLGGPPGTGGSAGPGNMSATDRLTLHSVDRQRLWSVIAEANREFGRLESRWLGLGGALAAMQAATLSAASLRRMTTTALHRVVALGWGRSFSNIGPWPREIESWANVTMLRSYFVPASADPRWITVAAYGQSGRTFVSMRTHRRGISADDVTHLAESMNSDARSAGDLSSV